MCQIKIIHLIFLLKNYNNYIKINANYKKNIEEEYERNIYLTEFKFNSLWDTIDKSI